MNKVFHIFLLLMSLSGQAGAQHYELKSDIPSGELTISCLPKVQQELTIIRSAAELKRLFPNNTRSENTIDCRLPSIDFSRDFVICLRPRSLSGCREPKIGLQLSRKKSTNLLVEMRILEYGRCFELWPDAFWVKIPLQYFTETIDFKISKTVQSIPVD
ncbi:hypothetical protein [Sunxiuqinia indica]|uniref:hypothetical protein n=1 Tax=Sunxiuqinia indica TaxID=2692584 RepID=UPI00135AC8CA|nr:hypothetical protein [Sunxiuqinia indica]